MKRTEVLIRPMLERVGATITNAVANSTTSSMANGNEQVHIIARIHLLRGYEDILMNEQVLIRGNPDHHEMVEYTHRLQKKLKQCLA